MNWRDLTNQQRDNIMNNLELKIRLENLESTMDKLVEALESTIQECENSFRNEERTDETLEFAQSLLEDIRKWERGED